MNKIYHKFTDTIVIIGMWWTAPLDFIWDSELFGKISQPVAKSSAGDDQLTKGLITEIFSEVLKDQMKSMTFKHITTDAAEKLWSD